MRWRRKARKGSEREGRAYKWGMCRTAMRVVVMLLRGIRTAPLGKHRCCHKGPWQARAAAGKRDGETDSLSQRPDSSALPRLPLPLCLPLRALPQPESYQLSLTTCVVVSYSVLLDRKYRLRSRDTSKGNGMLPTRRRRAAVANVIDERPVAASRS